MFGDEEKNKGLQKFAKAVNKGLKDDPGATVDMLGKLIKHADRIMDREFADNLKLLREREFKPETLQKLREIADKSDGTGLIPLRDATYNDLWTVIEATAEILDYPYVTKSSYGFEGQDLEKNADKYILHEFMNYEVKGIKVGYHFPYGADKHVGFGFFTSSHGDRLREQQVFDVAKKFYEVGLPLMNVTKELVERG